MSRALRHGARIIGLVGLVGFGIVVQAWRTRRALKAPATVLVVEDDPDLGAALSDVLVADGFSVRLASNGAEAIEALETLDRPCALLVDLLMPGIVGQEFLEFVRSDQALATIPVAIVSASPELAPPGYPVFQKPLDVRAVLQFVRDNRP